MTITVQCICGQKFRANESQIGKTFPCPKCGAPNTVTRPEYDPASTPLGREAPLKEQRTPALASARHIDATTNRRITRLPLVLSLAAVVIAISSTAWSVFRNPLGPGISAYDFTTPEKAIDSDLAISINLDMRAARDIDRLMNLKKWEEKRNTLKIHRDANYQGKKILFISFKENGITKYDIEAVEKDAETGLWFPEYFSTYDMDDDELEQAIKSWKNKTDADSE